VLHSARLDGPTLADAFPVGIRGVVLKDKPTRIVEAIATVVDGDVYVDPALAPAVRRYADCSP
jgi:DNA-binding NarL/FixJ family response regulator